MASQMESMTERTIRVGEVARITGFSTREVWRKASDVTSDFPKPHKLSTRKTVWLKSAVEMWAERKLQQAR